MNSLKPLSQKMKTQILKWFEQHQRPLPWRENRDPYSIWISETMLQQTTVRAVIPYYHRFIKELPQLKHLAEAPEDQVLRLWSGLGYYSRARNLHRAAKILQSEGGLFPKSYLDLIQLPGFGPYTSRAVASIAFNEAVGVLDGNVIRVLSRFYSSHLEWWIPKKREQLQNTVDQWVAQTPSHKMNQAIMEIGATICTPKTPTCFICPLKTQCQSLLTQTQNQYPLKKPKRAKEIWIWSPHVLTQGQSIALTQDHQIPFLKKKWAPPGSAKLSLKKPNKFLFKHSITHHEIYVTESHNRLKSIFNSKKMKWVSIHNLSPYNPTSLLKKLVAAHFENEAKIRDL